MIFFESNFLLKAETTALSRLSIWVLLVAGLIGSLKICVFSSWWGSCCAATGSFACAVVKHKVTNLWPLTTESLDFLETISLALILGLLVGKQIALYSL